MVDKGAYCKEVVPARRSMRGRRARRLVLTSTEKLSTTTGLE
jgi:hypothetical protein